MLMAQCLARLLRKLYLSGFSVSLLEPHWLELKTLLPRLSIKLFLSEMSYTNRASEMFFSRFTTVPVRSLRWNEQWFWCGSSLGDRNAGDERTLKKLPSLLVFPRLRIYFCCRPQGRRRCSMVGCRTTHERCFLVDVSVNAQFHQQFHTNFNKKK